MNAQARLTKNGPMHAVKDCRTLCRAPKGAWPFFDYSVATMEDNAVTCKNCLRKMNTNTATAR